jgi:hypothetical protein
VEVAVQAQRRNLAGAAVGTFDLGQRGARDGDERIGLRCRQRVAFEQALQRLVAVGLRVQPAPRAKRLGRAHRVQSADEAAEPLQHLRVVELGSVARAARIHREAEHGAVVIPAGQGRRVADAPQRLDRRVGRRLQRLRCNDRDLLLRELQREAVLFEDLRIAPARRPVELGHRGRAVFQHHLEHAVLVRVELQDAPVAAQADALQRVEHALRRQAFVRMGGVGAHRQRCAARFSGASGWS